METMVALAYEAIMAAGATEKAALIRQMRRLYDQGEARFIHSASAKTIPQPGMPANLQLVHPRELARRGLQTEEGKACFLQAIAHIEYNAINLALDAIYRFPGLPQAYYLDWLEVAEQEADHHHRIVERLADAGYAYGDFPAHNGLWDIAVRTAGDLVSRMAMVPCVFEARGLDVTPPMIKKLQNIGDHKSAEVLQFILQEEIGHVEVGIRWYQHACQLKQIEPIDTFVVLLEKYLPNKVQGPFNVTQRLEAGFSQQWLSRLESL